MKIKFSRSNSPRQQCCLCGSSGHHRKDIWTIAPENPTEMSEKIFRCVGVRLERNDPRTNKICETCIDKINEFDQFRELCAVTGILVEHLIDDEQPSGDRISDVEPNVANDTQSAFNGNWSVTGGELTPAASTNDDIYSCSESSSSTDGGLTPAASMTDDIDSRSESMLSSGDRMVTPAASETDDMDSCTENWSVSGGELTPAAYSTDNIDSRKENSSPSADGLTPAASITDEIDSCSESSLSSSDRVVTPAASETNDTDSCSGNWSSSGDRVGTPAPMRTADIDSCSENSSSSGDKLPSATETHNDIVCNGTKTYRRSTNGILSSSEVCSCAAIFDVNASDRTTSTESPLVHLFSARCGGYVKLENITNIASYSEMNSIAKSQKGSTQDQQQYSPSKDELNSGDKKDNGIEKLNGYVSVKKENTAKHKLADDVERFQVVCDIRNCRALFESSDAMIYHLGTYHKRGIIKVFSCHLCKKTLTSLRTLRLHTSAVHSRPDRFPCPFTSCSKDFQSSDGMQLHVNAGHTKIIAHKCTKCSYQSYYPQLLKRHLSGVHGEVPQFNCCWCKETFKTKPMLQQHKDLLHKSTNNISVKCPIETCPKYFFAKRTLQQHINAVHTKGMEFNCTKCSFKSFYKCSLVKHLAGKHR